MNVALALAIAELFVVGALTILLVFYFLSLVRSVVAGAPYVPMSARFVQPLLDIAPMTSRDTLVDLGCGDGRIIDAALSGGVGSAVGYEVAWFPLYLARRRLAHWGERATLIRQDARKADLTSATVVYMYLLPKIVDKLAPYLTCQLKSGTRVLSASFPINLAAHTGFRLLEERNLGRVIGYLYERT